MIPRPETVQVGPDTVGHYARPDVLSPRQPEPGGT